MFDARYIRRLVFTDLLIKDAQRAEEGIRRLLQEGRPVNFNTVAEVAHVSTAWLYQQSEVRECIEQLREKHNNRTVSSSKTRASDASKESMIASLRLRLKQLEAENRDLRQQIEVLYGQLYKQT
jgi:hypothetical protein